MKDFFMGAAVSVVFFSIGYAAGYYVLSPMLYGENQVIESAE